MIWKNEDYESVGHHSFNIDQVAKKIEKKIKEDNDIPYDGYCIDYQYGLISFFIKTGYDREYVEFDPNTLLFHVQNDLWISEFDELGIFRLLVLFSQIGLSDKLRMMKGLDGLGENKNG